jgi:pilus assembly protein CpaB
LIAAALATLAGLLAFVALRVRAAEARRGWTLTPVVVAQTEISEGATLTRELVAERLVPEQFVSSSVVRPDKAEFLDGAKVLVPLQRGDPILWTQLETTRGERLSTKILRKARAITIEASQAVSVGGWVRPNDHDDVLGTFRDPHTNEAFSITLLQNVVVIATGKVTGATSPSTGSEGVADYAHVSLLVLPEEAEILALAAQQGSLSLTLRNDEDTDLIDNRARTTVGTLLDGERRKELQRARKRVSPTRF